MEFLHCNRCFQRNPPGGYLISSCFHIFCEKCAKIDHTHCSICDKNVKIVRLNGNISQGIRMYFTDPIKLFAENMEKLQRKIDFQSNIRIHLIKHLTKEREKKRQIEVYCRKKGQEFEAQKNKLAEANSWILNAERKLQVSEEERIRLKMEFEHLQAKLQSLTTTVVPPTVGMRQPPTTSPFSFMMCSDELGRCSAGLVESSPNSTFKMVSPLVNSPARSLNDTNYHNFFQNTTLAATAGGSTQLGDDTMFATLSSNGNPMSAISEATAFSATFNNMFTPMMKEVESTSCNINNNSNNTINNQSIIDKTSASLDNWRTSLEISSRHETSLPTSSSSTLLPPTSSSHHQNTSASSTSSQQQRHRGSTSSADRRYPPIRDMRRYSCQPGYLAHRKSINSAPQNPGAPPPSTTNFREKSIEDVEAAAAENRPLF